MLPTLASYERRFEILSDHKLKLVAFIVTDTSISEKIEYRKLSMIQNVHVLTSVERAAETRFITRGVGSAAVEWNNMRQWFKTLLAFEDMVAYEKAKVNDLLTRVGCERILVSERRFRLISLIYR